MSGEKDRPGKPKGQKAKLAEALRLNLQRRKAQARSRGKGASQKAGDAAGKRMDGPENAE